MFGTTETETDS